MEIEGIVYSILPPVKGTSARGEWTKQEVIVEQTGEFSRKVCVSFWGDKAMDAAALVPGEKISVSVNLESREYNGRWYTEIRVWKMVRGGQSAPMPGPPAEQPWNPGAESSGSQPSVKTEDDFDDLPF